MIQAHLYAKHAETRVYTSAFVESQLTAILHPGHWMGVLENKGEWIHVLTINGEGWIKREDAEVRAPGGLHILLSTERAVEYVNY